MVDHSVEADGVEESETVVGEETGEGEDCVCAVRWWGEACHLVEKGLLVMRLER